MCVTRHQQYEITVAINMTCDEYYIKIMLNYLTQNGQEIKHFNNLLYCYTPDSVGFKFEAI